MSTPKFDFSDIIEEKGTEKPKPVVPDKVPFVQKDSFDFSDIIEEPVKKKDGTEPQETPSENTSSQQEPGSSDIPPEPKYAINGAPVKKEEITSQLVTNTPDFIKKLYSGEMSLSVQNDPALENMLAGMVKQTKKDNDHFLINAWERGIAQGKQANEMMAGTDEQGFNVERIAELQKEMQANRPRELYQQLGGAKKAKDWFNTFAQDPIGLSAELITESTAALFRHGITVIPERLSEGTFGGAALGTVINPGAGTAAGAALGASTGMIFGMGQTSLNLEYSGKIIESVQNAGYDVSKAQDLETAFSDETAMAEIKRVALLKGVPIAAFDAFSAGIAGRIFAAPAKKLVGKAAQWGTELIAQGALGAGGEVAGQVAAGEELSFGAAANEFIGEVAFAPVEIASNKIIDGVRRGTIAVNDFVQAAKVEKKLGKPGDLGNQTQLANILGEIDEDSKQFIDEQLANVAKAETMVPKDVPNRDNAVALIAERIGLEAQKEKTDPAFHKPLNDRIKEINDELNPEEDDSDGDDGDGGAGVAAKPEEKVEPVKPASVPLLITKKMEADLKGRGYTQDEINKMTPEQANEILMPVIIEPEKPAEEVEPPAEVGSPAYKEKRDTYKQGRTINKTIADGTKIKGTFKIVPASDVIASHNEKTFSKTPGFPLTDKGKTANDRDYETDVVAQTEVIRIAGEINDKAVSQTPIVSKEGVILDGNNRTMSRKLAAAQGTDQAYVQALKEQAEMFGFTEADIDAVENPMLVMEAEEDMPYTTQTFARFNKAEKKEKSPVEKAVELSKTLSDRARRVLGDIYDKAERPGDVTSNAAIMGEIKTLMLSEGILQPNELPRYINPETGTATKAGGEFLETLLIGSALNEDVIRSLEAEGMGDARQKILKAVVPLTQNAALGDDSLIDHIENGIKLLNKAKVSNQSVLDVIKQIGLWEVAEYSPEDLAIAVLLDGDGFSKFLKQYNSEVGKEVLFEGKLTKEKIIDNLLSQKIKNYEKIRQNLRADDGKRPDKVQKGDGGSGQKGTGKPNPKAEEVTPPEERVVTEKDVKEAEQKTARLIRDEKLRNEIDNLWDDFIDKTPPGVAAINPEQLALGIKIVTKYTQAGIYKLSDILTDASAKLGEKFSDYFDAIKAAYNAYYTEAPDDVAEQMDDSKTVRSIKIEAFQKKPLDVKEIRKHWRTVEVDGVMYRPVQEGEKGVALQGHNGNWIAVSEKSWENPGTIQFKSNSGEALQGQMVPNEFGIDIAVVKQGMMYQPYDVLTGTLVGAGDMTQAGAMEAALKDVKKVQAKYGTKESLFESLQTRNSIDRVIKNPSSPAFAAWVDEQQAKRDQAPYAFSEKERQDLDKFRRLVQTWPSSPENAERIKDGLLSRIERQLEKKQGDKEWASERVITQEDVDLERIEADRYVDQYEAVKRGFQSKKQLMLRAFNLANDGRMKPLNISVSTDQQTGEETIVGADNALLEKYWQAHKSLTEKGYDWASYNTKVPDVYGLMRYFSALSSGKNLAERVKELNDRINFANNYIQTTSVEFLTDEEIKKLPAFQQGKKIRGEDKRLSDLDLKKGEVVINSYTGEVFSVTPLDTKAKNGFQEFELTNMEGTTTIESERPIFQRINKPSNKPQANEPTTATPLEQTGPRTDATQPVGEENVQPDTGTSGAGVAQPREPIARPKDTGQSNSGIPNDTPTSTGIKSHTTVSGQQQLFGFDADTPGVDDSEPSSQPNAEGYDAEQEREDVIDDFADSSFEGKLKLQKKAEGTPYAPGTENIRKSLPLLLDHQIGNVEKAERRLQNHKGFGIFDGTGTGKTLSGLGIAKRFIQQGKKNILIVVPSDAKVTDWVTEAEFLSITARGLVDTKDGGKGGVISTTYANFRQNAALRKVSWDLVIYDESHNINSNKTSTLTANEIQHKALTGNKEFIRRTVHEEVDYYATFRKLQDNEDVKGMKEFEEKTKAEIERRVEMTKDAKVLFLTATPFAYHKNVFYADGYLFDTAKEFPGGERGMPRTGGDPQDQFLVSNLGYRWGNKWRNNVQIPESGVDVGLLERELHDKWNKEGAITATKINIPQDYSRHFLLVGTTEEAKIGREMDRGYEVINDDKNPDGTRKYQELPTVLRKKWTYLYKNRILEAIKAREIIEDVEKLIAKGEKVVVFHRYNEGIPSHPFDFGDVDQMGSEQLRNEIKQFTDENQDLVNLDLKGLVNPIETLMGHFGDRAVLFNGDVPKKLRKENVKKYNDSKSGVDVIVVNLAAGEAGLNLHDKVGDSKRWMFELGLPVRPTQASQSEGRIYREGMKSNAHYIYPVLHFNFEKWAFADINERNLTVENLAMGEQARNMETTYKEGYANPIEEISESTGTGGKDADSRMEAASAFEKAKTYYWKRAKKTSSTKSEEGVDYFATPEPLGMKMVEWMDPRPNDHNLEPSAGHGAIARFFKGFTTNTYIEPSMKLSSELAINGNGNVIKGNFEDHHIINKYDGIAMNPPYGHAGSTAITHLKKTLDNHLRIGGRIVGLFPQGAFNEKFDKLMNSVDERGRRPYNDIHVVARIKLPSVTFNRAGTSVNTQIIILDRVATDAIGKPMQETSPTRDIDLSYITDINEFFNEIENLEIRKRPAALPNNTEYQANQNNPESKIIAKADIASQATFNHTKTGAILHVVKLEKRVSDSDYSTFRNHAKQLGGYYSSYNKQGAIPGFIFDDKVSADKMYQALTGVVGDVQEQKKNDVIDQAVNALEHLKISPYDWDYKPDVSTIKKGDRIYGDGMEGVVVMDNGQGQFLITTDDNAMASIAKDKVSAIATGKRTFSLPFPPQLWNGFLQVVQSGLKAGKVIAEALKTGVDWLTTQGVNPDVAQQYADKFNGQMEVRRFTKRLMEDEKLSSDIKNQISDDAKVYAVKKNILTNTEALAIIDNLGIDDAIRFTLDFKNDLTFRVRVAMGQSLIRKLNAELKTAKPENKKAILDKAVDVAEGLAKYGTELGQGVQAFAMWSKLSPEGILMYYHKVKKKADATKRKVGETPETQDDADFLDELVELAQQRDQAPEGFLQDEITVKILNKIAERAGVRWDEVLWSLWYASILSGWQTQAVNLGSNVINTTFETFTSAMEQALVQRDFNAVPQLITKLWDGLAEGSNQFRYIMDKGIQLGKKSDKVEGSDALEQVTFKGGNLNPYNYYKYVPRLMTAVDNMAYYGLYHMRFFEMARKLAIEKGFTGQLLEDKVREIMVDDTAAFERAKEQAERDITALSTVTGEDYKDYIIKKRAYEILDQRRRTKYPDLVTEADRFASFGTFNYRPQGFLGVVANGAASIGRKVPPFRLIVPFTRIVANVLNQQVDYTPYGFLRATGHNGSSAWSRYKGKQGVDTGILSTSPGNEEQQHRALFKAAFGTTLMMGLFALTLMRNEDDDDYFDITGRGPSDASARNQLYAQGWKPYSVRVGNKYFSYQYTPLGLAFYLVGNYIDNERYKELGEKDFFTRFAFSVSQIGSSIMEMSFLASLSHAMQGLTAPGTIESKVKNMFGGIGQSVKPLVPVIGTNLVKQGVELFDPTIYNAETISEGLMKGIPFVQQAGLDATINALGQPSEKSGNRFWSVGTSDPVWKLLAEKEVFVPAIGRTTKLNGEPMSYEQYRNFVERSGQALYKDLNENLGEYRKMERNEFDEKLEETAKNIRNKVKHEMEMEYLMSQVRSKGQYEAVKTMVAGNYTLVEAREALDRGIINSETFMEFRKKYGDKRVEEKRKKLESSN